MSYGGRPNAELECKFNNSRDMRELFRRLRYVFLGVSACFHCWLRQRDWKSRSSRQNMSKVAFKAEQPRCCVEAWFSDARCNKWMRNEISGDAFETAFDGLAVGATFTCRNKTRLDFVQFRCELCKFFLIYLWALDMLMGDEAHGKHLNCIAHRTFRAWSRVWALHNQSPLFPERKPRQLLSLLLRVGLLCIMRTRMEIGYQKAKLQSVFVPLLCASQ